MADGYTPYLLLYGKKSKYAGIKELLCEENEKPDRRAKGYGHHPAINCAFGCSSTSSKSADVFR